MATELKMPKMGIDMVDGTIARWLKSEGDAVKTDEPIAEIETDKSTVELVAPEDGILIKVVAAEDELVPVGAVVAYIGQAGESVGGQEATSAAPAAEAAPAEAEPAPVEPPAEPAPCLLAPMEQPALAPALASAGQRRPPGVGAGEP